jgi:prevent-host-death family protein
VFPVKTLSVSKARSILGKLVEEAALEHEPIHIHGRAKSVVLVSEDDWRSIQETLYLLSIPGMRESILEGMQTPLEECSEDPGW